MSATDPFGLVGQLLDGQYRADALVGEGPQSAVYRGTHVGLGEPIAIKCLKLSSALAQASAARESPSGAPPTTPIMGSVLVDTFVKRFRDEGRILYKLSQDNLNVVRCLAAGTTVAPATGALVPYLVLEWLEGRSLEADLEARRAGRPLAEAMLLLEPALDAIAFAHSMGVVHRDISPGNIFLAQKRDGVRTKVLDFGVAKVMTDDLEIGPRAQTLANIHVGSPGYAAPEQFDASLGPPGPHTDVYSLALVAVEVLVGRPVRAGESLGEKMQAALDPNAPRTPRALGAAVPEAVERVFQRALAIHPSQRQRDAGELRRELQTAAPRTLPLELAATARQPPAEAPPKTQRLPSPAPPPATAGLNTTVRLPSAPPAAPAPIAPSASQLFQAPAVPPPPGIPVPPPSMSGPQLKTTERSAGVPPMQNATPFARPAVQIAEPLKQTATPLSAGSTRRAQWLVGLFVFVLVLAVGGIALRFWLLK